MTWRRAKGKAINKSLIWLLLLFQILSLVGPLPVRAEENGDPGQAVITISLRATGAGGDIFNETNFVVPGGEVAIGEHTLDRHTAMGALVYYCQQNQTNIEITAGDWGLFVNQIGDDQGDAGKWMYYVNGSSPWAGADLYGLEDGDTLHWANYTLGLYSLSLSLNPTSINPGGSITAAVRYIDGDGAPINAAGADIYVSGELDNWGSPVAPGTHVGKTGGDGKLTFTWEEAGTFYPYAEWNGKTTLYQWPLAAFSVAQTQIITVPPQENAWVKNGNTVLDALLKFQQADGSFWWREDIAGAVKLSTAQALAALVDLAYGESTKHRLGQAANFAPKSEQLAEAIAKTIQWYKLNYPAPDHWEGLPALWSAGEGLNSGPWQATQSWRQTDPGFAANATDSSHIHYIFRLLSVGLDPAHIWGGRNLFAELAAQQQQANGSFGDLGRHIWAMVALDAGRGLGKEVGSWSSPENRQKAVNHLLAQQNEDGSFGAFSQLDFTGWALVALSKHKGNGAVDAAIVRAVAFLQSRQQPSGGFAMPGEWGAENASTNAAVISGLVAVGIKLLAADFEIDVADPNTPLNITVPQGSASAALKTAPLTEEDKKTATLPSIQVDVATPLGSAELFIPQGTKVSGPLAWDGKIKLPELKANDSVSIANANVSAVIEVGFPGGRLDFDQPVRLTLPGQAGKKVGFTRGGEPVTEITTVLRGDSPEIASSELSAGGAGKIDVGDDLVVWTYHFTRFVAYTPAAAPPPGSGGAAPSAVSVTVQVVGKSTNYFSGSVSLPAGRANALEALKATGLPVLTRYNDAYVYEIAGEREDLTTTAGWKYSVNGVIPPVPAKDYGVNNGDRIIWFWAAFAEATGPGQEAPSPEKKKKEGEKGEIPLLIAEQLQEIVFTIREEAIAMLKERREKAPVEIALKMTKVTGAGEPLSEEEKGTLQEQLKGNIVALSIPVDPREDALITDDTGEILLYLAAGSLPESTEITVEEAGADNLPAPPTHRLLSSAYRLGPKGTVFSSPAVFFIRLAIPGDLDPADLVIAWLDEEAGRWYALPTVVNLSTGYLGAPVAHFTPFAVLVREKPFYRFSDLKEEELPWAYDPVHFLAARQILRGVGEGRFQPARSVTRAEFAAMLVEALGLEAEKGLQLPFEDVLPGSWYEAFVKAAVTAGIVKGVTKNAFHPDDTMTREQMAVMLSRIDNSKVAKTAAAGKTSAAFADAAAISSWARQAVEKTAARGLMLGFPDGTFRPREKVTRAQAAVVLYRLLFE